MRDYRACGVKVYFLLRLATPEDLSLRTLLCHPESNGGRYTAFNTVTEEGVNTLFAACDFLTSRYGLAAGETDNLIGFAVGSRINDAADSYNMGAVTLDRLAKDYGNALRIVYNAARARNASMAVYLPLGGDWYRADCVGKTSSFDARSTLDAVASYMATGGDAEWYLSYDIHTDRDNYAWDDTAPDLSSEASSVNAANAEVLINTLSREELRYRGVARPLLLLETDPWDTEDENQRIRLSADYVYTYLRLSSHAFASVRAYLPAHPVDYGDLLTYIDTNRFAEVTVFAAEIMGQAPFDTLLENASLSLRTVTENEAVTTVPSAVKGETLLFDFSEGSDGWQGSLHCASLKGGVELDGLTDLLSIRFQSAEVLSKKLRGG